VAVLLRSPAAADVGAVDRIRVLAVAQEVAAVATVAIRIGDAVVVKAVAVDDALRRPEEMLIAVVVAFTEWNALRQLSGADCLKR